MGHLPDEGAGLYLFERLLLGLASAVTFGSESRNTHDHILVSHLRLGSLFVLLK
jgi:hypothetical protein